MPDAEPSSPAEADTSSVSRGELIYATTLIAFASGFNYLDRSGLAILIEPIKHEFALTDTEAGLLTGFAFSVTYACFAIPLARLADTRNRVHLLSACIAVWSVATVLAGTVTSFLQMTLTRVVVGIGEAGGNPTSVSMLGDYYTPETRTRGLSLFNLGATTGATLGLALIGVIADQFGWRVAFYVMGAPGVLLAIVVFATLREPVRGRFQDPALAYDTDIGWFTAVRQALRPTTMRHLLIAYSIVAFGSNGAGAWFGAFFMRTHNLTLTEVGAALGLIAGLSSLFGTLLGALGTPWLVRRDRRWELWLPGFVYAVVVPVYMFLFYSDDIELVYLALGFTSFAGATIVGAILSAMQSVLPAHLRAMGMALSMFAVSFVGAGAGPLLVGWTSDLLAPQLGTDSLRYALILGVAVMTWGIVHFFLAAKHQRRDLVS